MTAAVTIEVRQQAAAAALHGLAAELKGAFLDPPAEPDPTTSTCIPSAFADPDEGTDPIGSAYENYVIG